MKTVYGLRATGYYTCFNDQALTFSKDIFEDSEDANRHIPQFVERCTVPGFGQIQKEGLKVIIIEYTLHEKNDESK